MSDQATTTPGIDHELDSAIAELRNAETNLRAAGDHLRQAVSGLPRSGLSEFQTMRYTALVHGIARALHELDKALDASGAGK